MRYFIVFFLVVAPWAQSHAMEWRELREVAMQRAADGSGPDSDAQRQLLQRLNEMVLMTVVYTRSQREQYPQALLFCPPQGRPFHLHELLKLIREQARVSEADGATPVQQLLLDGFRREFPCPAS